VGAWIETIYFILKFFNKVLPPRSVIVHRFLCGFDRGIWFEDKACSLTLSGVVLIVRRALGEAA